MKIIISLFCSLLLLIYISSCTKAPTGATGPSGATGSAGPGASYDVLFDSIEPTLTPSTGWNGNDSAAPTLNTAYYVHSFNLSYLSTSSLSQPPLIEVYYTISNGLNYELLPQKGIFPANSPDKLDYSFSNNTLNVIYSSLVNYPLSTIYVKIVVIPVP